MRAERRKPVGVQARTEEAKSALVDSRVMVGVARRIFVKVVVRIESSTTMATITRHKRQELWLVGRERKRFGRGNTRTTLQSIRRHFEEFRFWGGGTDLPLPYDASRSFGSQSSYARRVPRERRCQSKHVVEWARLGLDRSGVAPSPPSPYGGHVCGFAIPDSFHRNGTLVVCAAVRSADSRSAVGGQTVDAKS